MDMATSGLAHFRHQAIRTFFNVLRMLEPRNAFRDLGEKNDALGIGMACS
jgi:hypothetical protein